MSSWLLRGGRLGLQGFDQQIEPPDRTALRLLRGRAGLTPVERVGRLAHVAGRAGQREFERPRAAELLAEPGGVGLKRTLQPGQARGPRGPATA